MTQEEIIDGNKIIAIFNEDIDNSYKWDGYKFTNKVNYIMPEYHSSWDWLMPVVEKIESIRTKEGYKMQVIIQNDTCKIEPSNWSGVRYIIKNNKIETVWWAIVEFIKLYNKSNKEI